MKAAIIQPFYFDNRCLCFCISNSFTTSSLSSTPLSPLSLSKGISTCQIWGRKDASLRKIWPTKRVFPVVTKCSGSSNSSSTDTLEQSSTQSKVPFGYSRKDVLLIGVGVTVFGFALKSGLEFVGVDPLQAGNVVQLFIVLGMTVGWISTYMFRVANKDMTYAQQLRDYESKVMEKRLEGLTEAELQVLLEQVEEEKKRVPNSEQVN